MDVREDSHPAQDFCGRKHGLLEARLVLGQHANRKLLRRGIPAPDGYRSPRLPAWSVSILLHVSLFVSLVALWTPRSAGTSEVGGPIGIAVVYEAADTESYALTDSAESSSDSSSDASNSELNTTLPSAEAGDAMLLESLDGLLPSGDSPSDILSAGGALGLGDGIGELGGNTEIPKTKTNVFGIEGEGVRFVYVFDKSDSMNGYGGRPLAMAKSELLQSLDSLGPVHEFQIIFYNDSPFPLGGVSGKALRLYRGDSQSKSAAQSFVSGVTAVGGTQHLDALRTGLALQPDVIFFLTDADFPAPSAREIEDLHDRAARAGTTIHSVQFGEGPNQGTGGWIEHLAEGTLGKFRYVDVSQP